MITFLKTAQNSCTYLDVNFVWKCSKWAGVLKSKLVKGKELIGVLQITGEMDKHEKFAFIILFVLSLRLNNFNPRVLVVT